MNGWTWVCWLEWTVNNKLHCSFSFFFVMAYVTSIFCDFFNCQNLFKISLAAPSNCEKILLQKINKLTSIIANQCVNCSFLENSHQSAFHHSAQMHAIKTFYGDSARKLHVIISGHKRETWLRIEATDSDPAAAACTVFYFIIDLSDVYSWWVTRDVGINSSYFPCHESYIIIAITTAAAAVVFETCIDFLYSDIWTTITHHTALVLAPISINFL
jgi:hypothetical protein